METQQKNEHRNGDAQRPQNGAEPGGRRAFGRPLSCRRRCDRKMLCEPKRKMQTSGLVRPTRQAPLLAFSCAEEVLRSPAETRVLTANSPHPNPLYRLQLTVNSIIRIEIAPWPSFQLLYYLLLLSNASFRQQLSIFSFTGFFYFHLSLFLSLCVFFFTAVFLPEDAGMLQHSSSRSWSIANNQRILPNR